VYIYSFSNKLSGKIHKLEALINNNQEVIKKNPKCLLKNQNALVIMRLEEVACLELFTNYKALGRISLRDGEQTLAAGIITDLIS